MARKLRIRQTRTDWQKTFDQYPGMVNSISWTDRLPEVLHISIALAGYDYFEVENDFFRVADFVNNKFKTKPEFHFNLNHTIRLIKDDISILEEINKTCFKNAFHEILFFYSKITGIDGLEFGEPDAKLMFTGYHQILKGRSDIAIMCKYMMMKYQDRNKEDLPEPFKFYGHNSVAEILSPINVSKVFARFPITAGSSQNIDIDSCHRIWMYNYLFSPFLPKPDSQEMEAKQYEEINFQSIRDQFDKLYAAFKNVRLLTVFGRPIAEIMIGFVGRISDLAIEVMEFDRIYKGEISELVLRSQMESFIVAAWLLKRKDSELFIRFKEFSTGREVLFGELLGKHATTEESKKVVEEMVHDAIDDSGLQRIEVATERGDAFELRLDQMADEVFGKDNMYYILFKRLSDVTHGHWRVMVKYHLSESLNPMHNGLLDYNDQRNTYAGLIPSFMAINMAVEIMIRILEDIEADEILKLKNQLEDFNNNVWSKYLNYYQKYVVPNSAKGSE